MAKIGRKRANWYVRKNLVRVISPTELELVFRPSGFCRGEFYAQDRANSCVVCGSSEFITKHHIVPQCFRKQFPPADKEYDHHDILPLCRPCHDQYEKIAHKFKNQFLVKSGESLYMVRLAKTIIGEGKLPAKVSHVLHDKLKIFLKIQGREITEEDIRNLSNMVVKQEEFDTNGMGVIQIEEMWREHFLHSMSPKFLPKGWHGY